MVRKYTIPPLAILLICIGLIAYAEEKSPNRKISETYLTQFPIPQSQFVKESLKISPYDRRVAYAVIEGEKRSMVVNGKEDKQYDFVGSFIFSPDSKHVAYDAQIRNKWFVVIDGDSSDSLHYLAIKDKGIYLVEENLASRESAETEQRDITMRPFVFYVVLPDGQKVDLILGQTTLEQAVQIFPKPPSPSDEWNPSAPRFYPNFVGKIKPKLVFNPWLTMDELYFDENNKLVIITEPVFQETSLKEIIERYPQLKETRRDSQSFEMQGQIEPCVAFWASFRSKDSIVNQIAYTFTCKTK